MRNIKQYLRAITSKHEPLPTGFYSYHTPPEAPNQYRLHLRIEPDGEGVMIVNASSVLHLNLTGTEIAYYMVQGKNPEEIVKAMAKRFDASISQIDEDVRSFQAGLSELIRRNDQEPVADFGFSAHYDVSDISAPYRLDCCLTTRVEGSDDTGSHREMDTTVWKTIIKKVFDAGVPHVVFYGGEPTLREDLPELLRYCEDLGLVTGLVTSGSALLDEGYLDSLVANGLDHIAVRVVVGQGNGEEIAKKVLPLNLYTCLDLLVTDGVDYGPFIQSMMDMGVNAFSVHPADELTIELTEEIKDFVLDNQLPLIMDLPHPKLPVEDFVTHHVAQDLLPDYVILEADPLGNVRAHNHTEVMGNLLTDPWDVIWNKRI